MLGIQPEDRPMQQTETFMRQLPCGCTTEGFLCADHRRPLWGDEIACNPLALAALALFCGMIAVWAAILG